MSEIATLQFDLTPPTDKEFVRSAGGRLVHRLEGEVIAAGHRAALNTPYPGGYILSRHGRPARAYPCHPDRNRPAPLP